MISLALQQLRARWQRSLAVFIAVILGVAFFTIAMLAGGPLNNNLQAGIGQQFQGSDLVITGTLQELPQDKLDAITDSEGVAFTGIVTIETAQIRNGNNQSYLSISQVPEVPEVLQNIELESGRWPSSNDEIVIASHLMDNLGLAPGDEVVLVNSSTDQEFTMTIVGASPSPPGLGFGQATGFLENAGFSELFDDSYPLAIRVQLDPGADLHMVQDTLRDQLGDGFFVKTFSEYVNDEVSRVSGGTVALQGLLGAFALIALIASGIVITNTFEISVAQRVREIGLLRSVGASSRQVRRTMIAEALVTGVVASVVGVMLGVMGLYIVGKLTWSKSTGSIGLEYTPVSLGLPFILGIVATLVGAYAPARTAMRVHPLQALRHAAAPETADSLSRRRKLSAVALLVVGLLVLAAGVFMAFNNGAESGVPLALGIFGGALTFFAALMSTQFILPAVAGSLGKLSSRFFGITGDLASSNLARNPRRTASAAAALLMGITLMTMMTVGAANVRSTIIGQIEGDQPIDLRIEIEVDQGTNTDIPGMINRWESFDKVDQMAAIRVGEVDGIFSSPTEVIAIDPKSAENVVRSSVFKDMSPSTIVISSGDANAYGLNDGDLIDVSGVQGTLQMQVKYGDAGVVQPVISTDALTELNGNTPASGVWIRLHEGSSVADVVDRVNETLPQTVTLHVSGGASERESITEVLDTLLLVAIGLLAASVVIAIVGIANTLTLSVIERTRESGVLRAIGLRRGQVKRMLLIEGIILSLAGACVGIVLGVIYGFVGVITLFGNEFAIEYSIPWQQLGLIVLAAVLSGALASILPTRRALRVNPVEALAHSD